MPRLYVSARTGSGIGRILPATIAVFGEYTKSITTSVLNEAVSQILDRVRPPATSEGRHLKFYYAAQIGNRPPSFALFVNNPRYRAKNYVSYLESGLRRRFGFEGTPIILSGSGASNPAFGREIAIPFQPIPVLLGFLLGSIPSGLWLARARGVDLRRVGSGNIGATNAIRALGARWGGRLRDGRREGGRRGASRWRARADGARGRRGGGPRARLLPAGRLQGGRGVATSLGVFLAVLPVPALLALGVWIVLVAISRRVSVASIGAALAYPCLVAWRMPRDEYRSAYLVAAILIAALVVIRHIPISDAFSPAPRSQRSAKGQTRDAERRGVNAGVIGGGGWGTRSPSCS